ncbi:rubrerythrin, partial [Oxalobacteraceae bacterium GrIS 1.18]
MESRLTTAQSDHNRPHWRIEDIDFTAIDPELIRHDQFLFVTLASASFVEIHSEQYADNLIVHFRDDSTLTSWLADHWRRDEVQHGQALKAYVQTVWPEFDWEQAYLAFSQEYGLLCTVEQLEQHKALELIARCVVETGTSSFYRAMHNYVGEPVLKALIDKIRIDETTHYAHFRRHFLAYNDDERHSVKAIIQAIWRRLKAISNEDAYIAFKHGFCRNKPSLLDYRSDQICDSFNDRRATQGNQA